MSSPDHEPIQPIVQEVRDRLRARLRRRLVEQGGPVELSDDALDWIQHVIDRAEDARANRSLVARDFIDERSWQLETALRPTSHRGAIGRAIVAVKRLVILPLVRFVHEFHVDNTRRQVEINELLLACIETLAIEQARLRRALAPDPNRSPSSAPPPPRSGVGS